MRPLTRRPERAPRRPGRIRLLLRRARQHARPVLLGVGALAVAGGLAAVLAGGMVQRLAAEASSGLAVRLAEAGLRLQRIEIEGRTHTDDAALLAAVAARRGDPMLAIEPAAVRERLRALAWVREAEVRRRLPGTLEIRLTERTPFAIWQHQGRHVVIDRDGVVLAESGLERFGPLPLVVGAGAAPRAAEILDLVARNPAVNERFKAAVRVADRRWNIRLASGADVLLPEGAEAPALERLASLHAQHALLDRGLAAVDMRLPDRLVLRPLERPPERPPERAPEAPARRSDARGRG
jgi:cell division protein FtsQ